MRYVAFGIKRLDIARGQAAENDATQTSYTHEGLTPDTTYYYALVPNGNPDLTEGRANETTPDLERSAQASFLLLKSNGDEAGDTIGGTVTVVLELELENAEAGSQSAVVRIQETGSENEVTHDEDEDHIDFSLDLTQAAGWQQWLDPDDDGPQEASWQSATSAPVGTGKWRWSQSWNTAGAALSSGQAGTPQYSRLLNHNGEHTISLAQVDGGEGGTLEFGEESADVEDKNVEVGNLVITGVSTSNGTEDYFKWDPGSGEPSLAAPVVNFTVEDQSGPGIYRWTIYFAKTSDVHSTPGTDWTASARRVWGVSSMARSFSINLASLGVNGHLRMQPQDDPATQVNESDVPFDERSPYTFDIRVIKFPSMQAIPNNPSSESGEIGRAQFKQPYLLWIPHQFQTPATPTTASQTHSGHDIWINDQPDGTSEIRAKYYLYPNPAVEEESQGANSVKLTAMDPTFAERGSIDGPTNAGELHDDLLVGSILEDDVSGDWRVLFTAEDKAGAVRRRDHTNTRMIPVNQIKPEYKVGLKTVPGGHKYSGGLQPLGQDIPWGSGGHPGSPKFKPAPGAPAGSPGSIEGMEFFCWNQRNNKAA